MADILSTSVSGLLAFQQALDVTSNNIANSSTPGYSVERANLTPQPGQSTAGGYIGSGVRVDSALMVMVVPGRVWLGAQEMISRARSRKRH